LEGAIQESIPPVRCQTVERPPAAPLKKAHLPQDRVMSPGASESWCTITASFGRKDSILPILSSFPDVLFKWFGGRSLADH